MRTADDGAALWPDRYLIDGRLVVVRSPRGLECGDPRSLEPPGRPVEHLVDHRTWRGVAWRGVAGRNGSAGAASVRP
jgi:hypothetical protein